MYSIKQDNQITKAKQIGHDTRDLVYSLGKALTDDIFCKANLKPSRLNNGDLSSLVQGLNDPNVEDMPLVTVHADFKSLNIVKMSLAGSGDPKTQAVNRKLKVYYKVKGIKYKDNKPCNSSNTKGCHKTSCYLKYQVENNPNPDVTLCDIQTCVSGGFEYKSIILTGLNFKLSELNSSLPDTFVTFKGAVGSAGSFRIVAHTNGVLLDNNKFITTFKAFEKLDDNKLLTAFEALEKTKAQNQQSTYIVLIDGNTKKLLHALSLGAGLSVIGISKKSNTSFKVNAFIKVTKVSGRESGKPVNKTKSFSLTIKDDRILSQ